MTGSNTPDNSGASGTTGSDESKHLASESVAQPDGESSEVPAAGELSPSRLSLYSPLGNYLFSYSASALVLFIALFLGWGFKISNFRENSQSVVGPVETPSTIDSQFAHRLPPPVFVGRITGVVDCDWSDPQTATLEQSVVRIGRKYALAAGFLEITYDTGPQSSSCKGRAFIKFISPTQRIP